MTTAVPYKVPFDVYLPATKFCKETGQPMNATFVKTIDIDVYDNFGHQMLTEQAHIDIDREKILAYIGMLIEDDMWMDIPNIQFKHKRPIDMINDHEGQRELIEFIQKVKND